MIDSSGESARAIELFARCCERMNEFACKLRAERRYREVRTHADIRQYTQGWRLEKSVEADINVGAGYVAAWCIELGWSNGRWLVASNVNVSHSDVYVDLQDQLASSMGELEAALAKAVDVLISTGESDDEFSRALESLSKEKYDAA